MRDRGSIKAMTDNLKVLHKMREDEKGLRIYYDQYFLVIETRKYNDVVQYIIAESIYHKVLLGNEMERKYLEGIIGIKLEAYPCDYYRVKEFK